jgi:hypothetical protein
LLHLFFFFCHFFRVVLIFFVWIRNGLSHGVGRIPKRVGRRLVSIGWSLRIVGIGRIQVGSSRCRVFEIEQRGGRLWWSGENWSADQTRRKRRVTSFLLFSICLSPPDSFFLLRIRGIRVRSYRPHLLH